MTAFLCRAIGSLRAVFSGAPGIAFLGLLCWLSDVSALRFCDTSSRGSVSSPHDYKDWFCEILGYFFTRKDKKFF
jgi:hypothetical protein